MTIRPKIKKFLLAMPARLHRMLKIRASKTDSTITKQILDSLENVKKEAEKKVGKDK